MGNSDWDHCKFHSIAGPIFPFVFLLDRQISEDEIVRVLHETGSLDESRGLVD